MKVKELIKMLRGENPDLNVLMFAHDHDSAKSNEGIGEVFAAYEVTDENGYTFVALRP